MAEFSDSTNYVVHMIRGKIFVSNLMTLKIVLKSETAYHSITEDKQENKRDRSYLAKKIKSKSSQRNSVQKPL